MIFRYLYPVTIKKGTNIQEEDGIYVVDNDCIALWLDKDMMVSEIGKILSDRIMHIMHNRMAYEYISSLCSISYITKSKVFDATADKIYIDRDSDRYFLCDEEMIHVSKNRIEYIDKIHIDTAVKLPQYMNWWGLSFFNHIHIMTVPYCNTFLKQDDRSICYPRYNMDIIYVDMVRVSSDMNDVFLDNLGTKYPISYASSPEYIKITNIRDSDCIPCTTKTSKGYELWVEKSRSYRYNGYEITLTKKSATIINIKPISIYKEYISSLSDITIICI
jgi:hypothetical protein